MSNVDAAMSVCRGERPDLSSFQVDPVVLDVIQRSWCDPAAKRLCLEHAALLLDGKPLPVAEAVFRDDDIGETTDSFLKDASLPVSF